VNCDLVCPLSTIHDKNYYSESRCVGDSYDIRQPRRIIVLAFLVMHGTPLFIFHQTQPCRHVHYCSARKPSIHRLPRDQSFNQSNFITFHKYSEMVRQASDYATLSSIVGTNSRRRKPNFKYSNNLFNSTLGGSYKPSGCRSRNAVCQQRRNYSILLMFLIYFFLQH